MSYYPHHIYITYYLLHLSLLGSPLRLILSYTFLS